MRALLYTAVLALLLGHQSSCVRMELDADSDKSQEPALEALQISRPDSVVLCPLSAHVSAAGLTTMVWAGYPPSDDRLQLLLAQVSAQGLLLHAPQPLALLDNELAALEIEASDAGGLQVRAASEARGEVLHFRLSDSGRLLESHREPASSSLRVAEACEIDLVSAKGKTRVFRAPQDGEMPLFVEKTSH